MKEPKTIAEARQMILKVLNDMEWLYEDMSDLTFIEKQEEWQSIVNMGKSLYPTGLTEQQIVGEHESVFRDRLLEGYRSCKANLN